MKASHYLLYGCGQLGVMLMARFFMQWVIAFADSEGGGSEGSAPLFVAATVGAVFFAFRIFDGVTDPLAGALSDYWVRRGGERRTLLFWSFFLPPLGLALIFAPSADMALPLRWSFLVLGMLVFFVGYTLYAIPYWSLVEDYSLGDPDTRSRLSNMLGAALIVATALGFIASPLLIERLGFFRAALSFAAPALGLMLLPYFAQPRARDAPRPTPERAARPMLQGFWSAFRHRRFVAVLILFAGSQMSFTVMSAAAPYIAVHLLDEDMGAVALLLGPFLATAAPCFVAVPAVARRIGWERLTLAASVALGAVYACVGLLGEGIIGGPLLTASLVFATGGPMAAVLLGIEAHAVTACAEEVPEEVTSVYFGVYNLVVKGMNGAALYLTGALAGAIPVHGSAAVRAMGFSAGALLVTCVAVYLATRPRHRLPVEA